MVRDDSYDMPEDNEKAALDAAWLEEIDRRLDALERGAATTPWPEIRDAALARLAARNDTCTGGY